MVPKALWEYGVSDANDPTWVQTDISWPINPDVWETGPPAIGRYHFAFTAPTPRLLRAITVATSVPSNLLFNYPQHNDIEALLGRFLR